MIHYVPAIEIATHEKSSILLHIKQLLHTYNPTLLCLSITHAYKQSGGGYEKNTLMKMLLHLIT